MRIDELQIGDWVFDINNDIECQVDIKDFRNGGEYILDFYEPIPLTEAILEKNGFENMGNCYGELKIGEYRIMCDARNIAILHNEHVDVDVPVEFVHELQNVLRICRIEKKIEL